MVNETLIISYLTKYQSEWIPFRSEIAFINEFVIIRQICLNADERSYTAATITSAAVALCTFHFSLSEPSLPFLLHTPQLLLIRPASQTLILAWVKTLLPFGCDDSSFSLVAYRRTAVMEGFFFLLHPIISLIYRNEDNMELFALCCNYPDSLTLSLPLLHSLPSFHLPFFKLHFIQYILAFKSQI